MIRINLYLTKPFKLPITILDCTYVLLILLTKVEILSFKVSSTYIFKGQLISKCFLVSSILPKNERKNSTWGIIVLLGRTFSFDFWKNLRLPKRHFEINWHLKVSKQVTLDLSKSKIAIILYFRMIPCLTMNLIPLQYRKNPI